MTRRTFAKLWTAAAGVAAAPALMIGNVAAGTVATNDADVSAKKRDTPSSAPAGEDAKLRSELLLDLVFDKGPVNSVGPAGVTHLVVAVLGGTFEGPKLKGTVIGPAGDWIVARPDRSAVLDLRILLQTDDAQKILMTCRGIAYTPQDGTLFARILPMFETGAAKYAWLNNIVAVGVYRPMPEKVAYRIYQIL